MLSVRERFRIPADIRQLALETGSFTEALERHAGVPVRVRVLRERLLRRRRLAADCPGLPGSAHWCREVVLETGALRVWAETRVWIGGNVALLRALHGLGRRPLIQLLRVRRDCRRQFLHVAVRRGRLRRVSLYRIGRARVCVTEVFPLRLKA